MRIQSVLIIFCLAFFCTAKAQETNFNKQVEAIKKNIDSITLSEKELLKERVIEIEKAANELEKQATEIEKWAHKAQTQAKKAELEARKAEIKAAKAEAKARKLEEAKKTSLIIERKIEAEKKKLEDLISGRVNETISKPEEEEQQVTIKIKGVQDSLVIKRKINKKHERNAKRVHGGLNFAIGFHSLATDDKFGNDNFKVWGSKSVEVGYSRNVRILPNDNLLHLNYGVSVMVNKLKMSRNDYFLNNNGITELKPYDTPLIKSKFKNVYVTLPVNFEFDLTPSYTRNNRTYFPIKDSFRFGLGGYVGILADSKQVLKYRNDNGDKIRYVEKGNFNVNQWIYGVSAHFGYGVTVFYMKYNLTPLFQNNPINEYPFSIGIRFGG
ncbi:hypothetical protein KRX57_00970 [Weeksellaceae bacterium TAE3-ERU29]|nr:hypothetical protein [Weeksellaceae bacterium TAE3-ERU29]